MRVLTNATSRTCKELCKVLRNMCKCNANRSIFPQERKLMGPSAQTGSGVCRCERQARVPEGSEGFRSGAGPGADCRCRFRKLPVEGFRTVDAKHRTDEHIRY